MSVRVSHKADMLLANLANGYDNIKLFKTCVLSQRGFHMRETSDDDPLCIFWVTHCSSMFRPEGECRKAPIQVPRYTESHDSDDR